MEPMLKTKLDKEMLLKKIPIGCLCKTTVIAQLHVVEEQKPDNWYVSKEQMVNPV